MPALPPKPKFKDVKPIVTRYPTFGRGLNTLVNPTKIRNDELSVGTNIILVDDGAPARRWGSQYFGEDSGGSGTYGLYPYYSSSGDKELLKLEDGFIKLYDPVDGSWDIVSGASFSSGLRTDGVLAFDTLYLTNGTDPLTKYDGNGLSVFNEISAPDSNWSERGASLASGQSIYSYRVTAVNAVGETIATAATTIAVDVERHNWNPDPANPVSARAVTVSWNPVTGATNGYNVYGAVGGDETYIAHINGESVTSWIDYGTTNPSQFFTLPVGNSTGGVKGQFIIEFKSSLIIGGDVEQPSRVYYSAGVDKIDSFLISDGGGYVDISKNSADGDVKGLAKYQNQAVVLKERSVWQMNFGESAIPAVQNIVNDIGCVSHFTIKNVENDLFFLGRKVGGGAEIYVLGNEPNYLSVLRTNALSTRVRPDFQAISPANLGLPVAEYFDGRYIVFYPEGGATVNNTAIVYDRERLGFTKWTNIYANSAIVYYDSDGREYFLVADNNDGRVTELDESFTSDKGVPIEWAIRTKESDLDEPFLYKKYKWVNLRLRNVKGTVRIKIITDGVKTAYTTAISSEVNATALRAWQHRKARTRMTLNGGITPAGAYIIRRIPISRQGTVAIARSIAVEIYGDTTESKATLLDITIEARPKSKNFYPREEVISS